MLGKTNIEKMENRKFKNKNFIQAFKKAVAGIIYGLKTQRNIKIQGLIAIVVIILGFVLKINIIEWVFIVFSIMFVLATEVINTAIETVVDMYTSEYNELARIAKDVAAGAVLLAAINSVVVAGLILLSRVINIEL